ncbi:exosortase B [Scleromatobacter humisilvae]|uniref:Exosortase B n=1 Tax=Scleromatobacter humisilvae TaxID=2897159 RepID=A0A9X1YHK7_9BURK|nr:exosortase B [Scleromatobacter humisilvae]MCK9685872.1 exosortase B [Scleromatobacter humisilvae]
MSVVQRLTAPRTIPWWICVLGLLALYLPTLRDLAVNLWFGEAQEQSQGVIVLAICVWLIFRSWDRIDDTEASSPRPILGWALMAIGLLLYVFGRSQRILSAQTASALFMLPGVVLLLRGPRQLRGAAFALFFMFFLIPLPATFVDAITQPMKLAVSTAATAAMYAAGYPIARTGVILQIGQYQLLVADACAGLHTLFSLEAMGLLYLNVVRHSSVFRNIALAILIVPISFVANVIRVIVLALITYYYGDEAGQGFLHGAAGMVLFLTALLFIIATDSGLRWLAIRTTARPQHV